MQQLVTTLTNMANYLGMNSFWRMAVPADQ